MCVVHVVDGVDGVDVCGCMWLNTPDYSLHPRIAARIPTKSSAQDSGEFLTSHQPNLLARPESTPSSPLLGSSISLSGLYSAAPPLILHPRTSNEEDEKWGAGRGGKSMASRRLSSTGTVAPTYKKRKEKKPGSREEREKKRGCSKKKNKTSSSISHLASLLIVICSRPSRGRRRFSPSKRTNHPETRELVA